MEDGQLSDSDSDMTVAPSDRPLQVPVSGEGARSPGRGRRRGGRGARAARAGAAAAGRQPGRRSRRGGARGPRGLREPGVRPPPLRFACAAVRFLNLTESPLHRRRVVPEGQLLPKIQNLGTSPRNGPWRSFSPRAERETEDQE